MVVGLGVVVVAVGLVVVVVVADVEVTGFCCDTYCSRVVRCIEVLRCWIWWQMVEGWCKQLPGFGCSDCYMDQMKVYSQRHFA